MIFAIDPGNKVSTAVLVRTDGEVDDEVTTPLRPIDALRDIKNDEMLDALDVADTIDVPNTGLHILIEDIESFGMNVGREVFRTAQWAGRFEERSYTLGYKPQYVKRSDVKLALCRSRRAKDPAIRAAIIDMYGGSKASAIGLKASPGPLYGFGSHAWSALALALTWWQMREDKAQGIKQQAEIDERFNDDRSPFDNM